MNKMACIQGNKLHKIYLNPASANNDDPNGFLGINSIIWNNDVMRLTIPIFNISMRKEKFSYVGILKTLQLD